MANIYTCTCTRKFAFELYKNGAVSFNFCQLDENYECTYIQDWEEVCPGITMQWGVLYSGKYNTHHIHTMDPVHSHLLYKCYGKCSMTSIILLTDTYKQTPWLESASKLYRPSDCRLSAKLVPTLADRGCRVVSATNPPQSLFSVF
jgi:hypothetical protein